MYSPNFRLPTLSEHQRRSPDDYLYASERKNRDEEKQDKELGERVDRLRERMWAIIERSRVREESESGDSTDSDADTSLTPDVATPSSEGEEELQLQLQ